MVQHDGYFDFVEVEKLVSVSHVPLPGFKVINMAGILKRAGNIGYADATGGLQFLNIISGGGGQP